MSKYINITMFGSTQAKLLFVGVALWWLATVKEVFFIYDAETLILVCFVLFLRFAYTQMGSDLGGMLDERKDLVVAEYTARSAVQKAALKDLRTVYQASAETARRLDFAAVRRVFGRALVVNKSYKDAFEAFISNEVNESLQSLYLAEQSSLAANHAVLTETVFAEVEAELVSGKWNFEKAALTEVLSTLKSSKL